jgi:hypothetical protein
VKKLQLEVEADLSFLLFGLVSNHKASKLLFHLNQLESLNFERVADLDLPDYNPNSEISFSKFAFHDEENHLDFYLVTNKEFGLCLFAELKQFDYLLIVRGGLEFFDPKQFTQSCMQLSGIQFMTSITSPKILSKISWII